MAAGNLARSLKFVFGHEGGYGNDPRDRGNWTTGRIGEGTLKGTKYGIAAHVYPHLDIKNLTLSDAADIYRRDYAAKVAYNVQPGGVDHTMLDIGINAGVGRAIQLQAAALGLPAKTDALTLAHRAAREADKVQLIKDINRRMLSFYRSIPTYATYGNGWSRRNAEREAISVKWSMEDAGSLPGVVAEKLREESNAANTKAKEQGAAAGGAGGSGAAGGSQVEPSTLDALDWAAIAGCGAMLALLIAFLCWHAWKNRARYQAYLAAARGLIG